MCPQDGCTRAGCPSPASSAGAGTSGARAACHSCTRSISSPSRLARATPAPSFQASSSPVGAVTSKASYGRLRRSTMARPWSARAHAIPALSRRGAGSCAGAATAIASAKCRLLRSTRPSWSRPGSTTRAAWYRRKTRNSSRPLIKFCVGAAISTKTRISNSLLGRIDR